MELQTPYFVIEEAVLQKYYDMLTDSLEKNWGNYLVGYSFKTNSLPWLVSFMKKQGAYAEVVSQDEYSLARYMGFRDDEIVYNGPYKSVESFRNVLMAGGYMNLDSQMELNTWVVFKDDVMISEIEKQTGTGTHTAANSHLPWAQLESLEQPGNQTSPS